MTSSRPLCFVAIVSLSLVCLQGLAVARCNLLPDVHGYNTGKGTVVPLRGVAEWLGAQVQFTAPQIIISHGSKRITMKLGSKAAQVNGRALQMSAPAKAYGGITCVPLRAVSEALGVRITYHADGIPAVFGVTLATLEADGRLGHVIVHVLPPDDVTKIVSLYAQEMNSYHGDDVVIWAMKRDQHGGKVVTCRWNDQTGTYDYCGRPDVLWVRDGVWEMGCYIN